MDAGVPGLRDGDFDLASGERLREAITRSWNRLVGAWAALEAVRVAAEPTDALTSATRERFLLPLMDELGFGRIPVAHAVEIEGTSYPMSHGWGDRVPVHLVGFGVDLDNRTRGVRGAAGASPHALVQEYLNRSDAALWGIVANGRTLRLLRDSTSLTRQAYVEFDLEAILTGELYADFALLWSVCHRTRFEGERPADCLLERWTKQAADDVIRALDQLSRGVEDAIKKLGAAFLSHPANGALREALRSGDLDRQDYYRELLRLVYRLIFLFTAEDRRDETTGRELLLDPTAPDDVVERYRRYYSTVRLRAFAGLRRGTRHPDLWVSLRRVMEALGGDGAPTLALPALGSFLFGPNACPHLEGADLRNEDLLDAVRALATIEEDRRLRVVDYRNLGAEELGGVYEGLLELHPRIELDATPPRFILGTTAGNERKATGSYYTPSSLINCLLDSALEPVVDDAVKGKKPDEAERAILELAVVDPAAGSGHFLVAAAHRIAKRLAAIRTGEGEPAPAAVRRALREVIAHCIYAVDLNPMAVELCKVSLWLEALHPGRPLSFLDAHIKCGNSLLGATPELVASGVPDAAFEAITGDTKGVVRAWRDENRRERDGQQALFEAPLHVPTDVLAREVRSLEAMPEETLEAVAKKASTYAGYVDSAERQRATVALDAWCAAFVVPKDERASPVTSATVRAFGTNPSAVPTVVGDLVTATAGEYAFFHWPIEFPAVMERGGFDVVLGNPPWDQVQLDDREFFATAAPTIAEATSTAVRKRLIGALATEDPDLFGAYESALRRVHAVQHFVHNTGRFPLTSYGRLNAAPLFAELSRSLVAPSGRVGLVLPTGIATDAFSQHFFGDLVQRGSLASLYDFENKLGLFPEVDSRMKFCLLTMAGAGIWTAAADLLFFAQSTEDLARSDRRFSLRPEDFELLNPNTRSCPTFRSSRDADLAKAIYRRVPILIREAAGDDGNPWQLSVMLMFMMNTDSGLFHATPGPDRLPLYEAKLVHQFTHRWATYQGDDVRDTTAAELRDPSYQITPRWWVETSEVSAKLAGRTSRRWLLGWRDITNATNERTVIASALPRVGVGNSLYVALADSPLLPMLLANLGAFALDWVAKQSVGGTHLNLFIAQQLPVLPPDTYAAGAGWADCSVGEWLRPYLAELVCTTDDMEPFARDIGWEGRPFVWNEERRARLRAELDAAFFHLYDIARDDVVHMLDAFPIVRRHDEAVFGTYRTLDLVLDAYEAMAAATPDRPFATRLEPAPGDPRAAHASGGGEGPGRWRPWSDVITRSVHRDAGERPRRPADQPVPPAPRRPPAAPAQTVSAVPVQQPAQSTLGLSESPEGNAGWISETATEPAAILMGQRVRHRSRGTGTVLSVMPTGKAAELLIRFDTGGDAWMAFGYGVLEFQR